MDARPATANEVRALLRAKASRERARHSARYFKTGPGEYGEGDVFVGVTVPAQRAIARAARALPRGEVLDLLASKVHEERLTALLILVARHARAEAPEREALARLYLANLRHVDNWDLVDVSAPCLLGDRVRGGDLATLEALARSRHPFRRRVAMLATFAATVAGDAAPALHVAELLRDDEHDLVQKAVGWMLREIGKRAGVEHLRGFLAAHAHELPRTMLRYAIERLPRAERDDWLGRRAARQRVTS